MRDTTGMAASMLSKCTLCVMGVAITALIVGMATRHWLEKEIRLEVSGSSLGLPPPLNETDIKLDIAINVGLFVACKSFTIDMILTQKKTSACDSGDNPADWLVASAVCVIAALVLGVASLVICALTVFMPRFHTYKPTRFASVIGSFLVCGLILSSLILYVKNKTIGIDQPIAIKLEFELAWSYFMTATSAALFSLALLIMLLDIIWNPARKETVVVDAEMQPSKVVFGNGY